MLGGVKQGGRGAASTGDARRLEAWEAALRLLAMRARTTQEVRQGLARRGYLPADISAVILRLTSEKYLDDLEFARTWVRSAGLRRTRGPARQAQELRAKGVGETEIAAALADLPVEGTIREVAEAAAVRKLKGLRGVDPSVARRRLAAHLERQGFPADAILVVCREHFPGEAEDEEGA
ncbi:MAG TPA: regulatory protein RecX [Candidatus Methylomirabilis sp.]|nr:regulatory protein RecX [Candidatus Methylomirabilis sp.]